MRVIYSVAIFLSVLFSEILSDMTSQEVGLCQQYGQRLGYEQKLVHAKLDKECTLTCTAQYVQPRYNNNNWIYDYNNRNDNNNNASGIDTKNVIITGTITTETITSHSLGNLESCDTQKVCLKGACVPINTDFQDECTFNFGKNTIAVKQSTDDCQINCFQPMSANGDGERSRRNYVLIATSFTMTMPDRAPCKRGLCRLGNCMKIEHFPPC